MTHASTGDWDLGDEFPTAWADDGYQYAGAGDNTGGKAYPGSDSPLTMWRIATPTNDPTHAKFSLVGSHTPVTLPHLCPITKSGVPNLKSNAVFAIGEMLYWAVACFDYIDPDIDPNNPDVMAWGSLDVYFNRQRYGVNDTSFIMSSADKGLTWDLGSNPHNFFKGRLAAPRLINAGQSKK